MAQEGLTLRPARLLIVGSPKVGSPLMRAFPTIAIDLPLKVLVWQDEVGRVRVTYNGADYLVQRHGLDAAAGARLAPVSALLDSAVRCIVLQATLDRPLQVPGDRQRPNVMRCR